MANIHHINIRYYHEHSLYTEYICHFSVKLMSWNESHLWGWASTNAFKNVPNGHLLTKNKYIYWGYILCLWHFIIQKHMNCCYEHEFLVEYPHTYLERQIFSWKSVRNCIISDFCSAVSLMKNNLMEKYPWINAIQQEQCRNNWTCKVCT